MLLTILAVFARIFSNAYSNVVQKQLTSHGEPSLKVNCFSYIALSAVMIPCLPFLELEKLGAVFWTPMAASGILGSRKCVPDQSGELRRTLRARTAQLL